MTTAAPTWQQRRIELAQQVDDLRRQGICDTCYDLETGGALYGRRYVVYEDDLFTVKLEPYPRARGHTIVLYKPHRADLSELSAAEAGRVFQMCVAVVKAIKGALSAEKVYLNTMCDGVLSHLHLQLFPRYTGECIGSTRFVVKRHPIIDGDDTTQRIRAMLEPTLSTGSPD